MVKRLRKVSDMSTVEHEEVERRFLYHPPSSEAVKEAHERVSFASMELAKSLVSMIPPSRGLSLALTKLEEARMWANQAIATGQEVILVSNTEEVA